MTNDEVRASAEIELKDLLNPETSEKVASAIAEGFGNSPDCLGIVIIKGLGDEYAGMRKRLLALASSFAELPEHAKENATHLESSYLFGWSHGKEIMNGEPDFAKGSYYNNPVHDRQPDAAFRKAHPEYGFDNVWPEELPELKEAFMQLGSYIVDVGLNLARHCDNVVRKKYPDLPEGLIEQPLKVSRIHKARLLHYFPLTEEQATQTTSKVDSWCGLHIDHSMLTGLTSAMYLDASDPSHTEIDLAASPEKKEQLKSAGLYIKSRGERMIKVSIPIDCLAFQVGEASQVASRGLLVATPHLVRGGAAPNIARNTFAVFIQPDVDHHLTPEKTFHDLTVEVMKRHYA